MKKQFGRLMKTVFAASVAVSFVTPLKAAGKGPEEFDRWMEEEFIETMESDYMSMHFSVRDYRAMGIE